MLTKIKNSLMLATSLLGVLFILNLFIFYKLPIFPQQLLHFISDWGTILITFVAVLVPFFIKTSLWTRVIVSSSSFVMFIMYIMYKLGFETVKEVVSAYGFNIATSYMSIVIVILFVMLARRLLHANINSNKYD